MAHKRQFNTFSGVFIPSLLTIVGAIMYLRLGWIVGEAGLINSILIISLSFLIALTTGLSLSSIATDKKIQKDGIYYMLSRSLGLPMGGAISIAIIIALVFNIAIQIIGLSESILGIASVSKFLHLAPNVISYRIVGTAILFILFIIVIITNSAIFKLQYIVFIAIIVSLASITSGFFIHKEIYPAFANIFPVTNAQPWIYLFSIFFPASTGFTAGIAFSNKLNNPKKSIPIGIISAIITSTIIYTLIIFAFAYYVKPSILINNTNFLPAISWSSTLTTIGIWISIIFISIASLIISPKILHSIASDRIFPRFFTYTVSNKEKPIYAIICIFILTEFVVLIGNLNAITHIATICILMSYAFINLAFMLEKLSNPDFRPTFNVSKYIGLVGLLACIVTMYEINPFAMLGACFIMTLLYFMIRRQKLQMEYGDVWQNVLLFITRSALSKINKRKLENKNWQPNIIVFSGGNTQRPYLVDFGKWIVSKHGFLSNFNMTTSSKEKFLSQKIQTSIIGESNKHWIETKNFPCNDIYSGIETVASTYGFTGIEPNTVILGFNSTTIDRERYIAMLANITKLDKNILLIHFDNDAGYGNKKIIDVWITPGEKDSLFALDIVKLLWMSVEWSQSNLRINVVNTNNSAFNIIYNKIDEIQNQLRISGEIRIVNNELENKRLKELIQSHSADADLIFIAIPHSANNSNSEIYDQMEDLSQIGTTMVFIKSSSQAQSVGNLDIITKQLLQNKTTKTKENDTNNDIPLPIRPEAATYIKELNDKIEQSLNKIILSRIDLLSSYFKSNIKYMSDTVEKYYTETKSFAETRHYNILACKSIKQQFDDFSNNVIPEFHNIFINLGGEFLDEISAINNSIPEMFTVFYEENLSFPYDNDTRDIVFFKKKMARYFKHSKHNIYPYEVKINKFIKVELEAMYNSIMQETLKSIKNYCLTSYYNINDIVNSIDDTNAIININYNKNDFQLSDTVINIKQHIETATNSNSDFFTEAIIHIEEIKKSYLEDIKKYFDTLNFGKIKPNKKLLKETNKKVLLSVNNNIETLSSILPYLINRIHVNIELSIFKIRLNSVSSEISYLLSDFINNKVIPCHTEFSNSINECMSNGNIDMINAGNFDANTEMFSFYNEINDRLTKSILRLPAKIQILNNQSLSLLESDNIDSITYTELAASRLLDYTIQYNYSNKIKKLLDDINIYASTSIDKHKDIITQISFAGDDYQVTINRSTEEINEEINNLRQTLQKALDEIQSLDNLSEEKLQLEAFIASAPILRNIINLSDKTGNNNFIITFWHKISSFTRRFFTNIWYRQSTSIIMTRKLKARTNNNELLKQYFEAVNRITLQPSIDQVLPYSYKQLFINTQQYNKELWIGRSSEINDFHIFLTQYSILKSGAIMVIGGIGSGKTFFCYHVARTFFPNQQIFSVKSVTGGSASISKFETSFLNAIDMQNIPLFNAIKDIQKGSIFILDNIEQWWHRGDNGNIVIEEIINLINKYSNKYLFILNSNTEGFNTLNITTNIGQVIIGSINLLPFNAEELEMIILRRHKAGNIKMVINNKNEKFLRSWHYAKLFTQYYKLTDGNIKSALSTWIACIDKIDDDTLFVHQPVKPETMPLRLLSKQQLIFLIQFIIHNNMSFERISAIFKRPVSAITEDLNVLIKYRLIEHKNENVYGINTILYPYILSELKKNEMI